MSQPGMLEGAGFWPRAAARIIDVLLQVFTGALVGFFVTFFMILAAGGHLSPVLLMKLRHTTLLSFVLAIVGTIVYETVCEGLHGSTLGKMILSLVVVQEDGQPCGMRSALIRSLAYFVDSLFFGLIGYMTMQKTPQQQRYGDQWANTIVCRRSAAPPASLRGGGTFVLALLLGTLANARFLIIGVVSKLL